ncbi:MAG TPA: metal-dependent hydrolase [Terrimicrobiaceae bacterium]
MDSLTQIALGSAVAALIAPARHRRTALAAGAVLGTLPDLDIIPLALLGVDPVDFVTWHRGPSHSLFVLALVGWLLWLLLRRSWTPVREAPTRWFWAIEMALLTHPLLDAFTVYGTQLFWPLPGRPVMGASIFIIDPAYTVPLLAACAAAWWLRGRRSATLWLLAGVCLSTAYLAWSLAAKVIVEREVQRALVAEGLQHAPRFSVPMPFNTLLWRVVVMTPDGFLESERSIVVDRRPMIFRRYASDRGALEAVSAWPSVQRLDWFTLGFLKAEQRDGRLVLSDLRMGAEPDYVFRYVVAESNGEGNWQRIAVERLAWRSGERFRLAGLWRRIWNEPNPEEAGIDG